MNTDTNILEVKGLQVAFEGEQTFVAVKNTSFNIGKGKTLAIVGESGSGKSITALSLMGLLPKNAIMQGNIFLNTNDKKYELADIKKNKDWQEIRGKEIGMIFQEPMSSLNPVMTVGKQLAEAITTHQNISKKEAKQTAIAWLQKVQLPDPATIYERYPHQLSGGQKQRVMIAMAMCNHPVLLIADEPTTALDVTVQQEIIRLMQYLQEEYNTALIFITHDLALAATIADEVMVMYKGDVVEWGTAEQVLKHPVHAYTKALIACKPSSGQKNHRLPIVADFMSDEGSMVSPDEAYINTVSDTSILQVDDLKIWFAEEKNFLGVPKLYFKAVDGVSFSLNKGEILGLVGESGCGKSTLGKSLIGLLPVTDGHILFENKDISNISNKEWRDVRTKVQMIFQDPYASLNPRMIIGNMLAEPLLMHDIVSAKEVENEVKRLIDIVHLPKESLKKYPHEFSGGQRQRIGIARALALRPELLICDESVSALDVSVQAQILNLLKELQQEFQLSYLFISHDLDVVYYISDRVMVMEKGKIVESGDAEQVLKHPKHDYTKRLINSVPDLK